MKNLLSLPLLLTYSWAVAQEIKQDSILSDQKQDSLIVNSNLDFHHQHLEHISELKEKSDKFNVYLNFQAGMDVNADKNSETEIKFTVRQLRLEFRGDLTDKIFYRLRHRLNKPATNSTFDNLSAATDMMYVGFRINDKTAITLGKMSQSWGGFEFDYNPIYVYEFSDFVNNIENYMVGGLITYSPNEKHEFNLNITNSNNNKLEDTYKGILGLKKSKIPFTYIFNWNGSLFNNKLLTRWSVGYQQEAEGYGNVLLLLGTKLNLSKFQIFFDYMRSDEDLDKLKYAKIIGSTDALKDVTYNSFVSKAEYHINEKWNIFLQGMYETSKVGKVPVGGVDAHRKSYGYLIGAEYTPFKKQDLHFFATYVGRTYNYKFSELNHYTNRFTLGMTYRIKAF